MVTGVQTCALTICPPATSVHHLPSTGESDASLAARAPSMGTRRWTWRTEIEHGARRASSQHRPGHTAARHRARRTSASPSPRRDRTSSASTRPRPTRTLPPSFRPSLTYSLPSPLFLLCLPSACRNPPAREAFPPSTSTNHGRSSSTSSRPRRLSGTSTSARTGNGPRGAPHSRDARRGRACEEAEAGGGAGPSRAGRASEEEGARARGEGKACSRGRRVGVEASSGARRRHQVASSGHQSSPANWTQYGSSRLMARAPSWTPPSRRRSPSRPDSRKARTHPHPRTRCTSSSCVQGAAGAGTRTRTERPTSFRRCRRDGADETGGSSGRADDSPFARAQARTSRRRTRLETPGRADRGASSNSAGTPSSRRRARQPPRTARPPTSRNASTASREHAPAGG